MSRLGMGTAAHTPTGKWWQERLREEAEGIVDGSAGTPSILDVQMGASGRGLGMFDTRPAPDPAPEEDADDQDQGPFIDTDGGDDDFDGERD